MGPTNVVENDIDKAVLEHLNLQESPTGKRKEKAGNYLEKLKKKKKC